MCLHRFTLSLQHSSSCPCQQVWESLGDAGRKLGSFHFICPPAIWWLRLNACVCFLRLLLKSTAWQVGMSTAETCCALGERSVLLGRVSSGPVLYRNTMRMSPRVHGRTRSYRDWNKDARYQDHLPGDLFVYAQIHTKCNKVAAEHAGIEKSMQKSKEASHLHGSQKHL